MRFLRHVVRLLKELCGFAWQNKLWWIVPVVLFLLLLAGIIVISQSTASVVYTFF